MSLHSTVSGSGPDLVLIHGWGLHGGIWDTLVPLLEPHFRVTRVDLPGHGGSAWGGERTLDDMAQAVLCAAPSAAYWVGWSLGGLVALRAALREPVRIPALVLLASTPCFIRKPDWPYAMLPELLDTFAAELETDYARTLQRFLALQVRGSEDAGATLRQLRATLQAGGLPQPQGLRTGLAVLRESDLRRELPDLQMPVQLLGGARDTLVPAAAAQQTARLLPRAQLAVIDGAGHAPFITRPAQVALALQSFLQPASVIAGDTGHG